MKYFLLSFILFSSLIPYFPGGKLHSYGYTDPNDPGNYFFVDGKWEIKDKNSCITINYSRDNIFTPGDYWCDPIIEINTKVFTYNLSGENVTMYRVSDGRIRTKS